jgi:hypothetical protein
VNLRSAVLLQVDSVLSADGWRPARHLASYRKLRLAEDRNAASIGEQEVRSAGYFFLGIGVSQPAMSDGFTPFAYPSKA